MELVFDQGFADNLTTALGQLGSHIQGISETRGVSSGSGAVDGALEGFSSTDRGNTEALSEGVGSIARAVTVIGEQYRSVDDQLALGFNRSDLSLGGGKLNLGSGGFRSVSVS